MPSKATKQLPKRPIATANQTRGGSLCPYGRQRDAVMQSLVQFWNAS